MLNRFATWEMDKEAASSMADKRKADSAREAKPKCTRVNPRVVTDMPPVQSDGTDVELAVGNNKRKIDGEETKENGDYMDASARVDDSRPGKKTMKKSK